MVRYSFKTYPRLAPLRSVAVLALLGGQGTALAADPSQALEEITITAMRYATPVANVPATVTVLTAERMEAQLVENIEDLVRFEPGVSVRTAPARFTAAGSSLGRDGNSGFNIRGLEGNRVLIQVDGVRVPDAFSFGAQSTGRGDYVDLGLLKSVEILRGPASALYGSDGVAGAVSFITNDPADLLGEGRNVSLRLRSSYADADRSLSHSLIAAGRLGGWDGLVSYTRRDGEGQQTQGTNDSASTNRTTANPEENRSNAVLAKLVREINEQQRLRLTWDHLDRDVDWNVLSAVALPPLTATSVLGLTAFDTLRRDRFSLDHFYESEGGTVRSVRTSLSHQASETRQYSAEDRNTAADRIRDARFDNAVWGALIEARNGFRWGATEHDFVYGGDFMRTRQQSVRDGTVPPPGETFPARAFPTTDYTLAGVYLQDEVRWQRLSLFPALRWDSFRLDPRPDPLFTAAVPAAQSDSQLSPKLGALLRLGGGWSVFANAATGFRAPAANQVNNGFTNLSSNYASISNPDLKPETSETLEAGVRAEGTRWSGSLTGFTGSYDDFIEQVLVSGNFTPSSPGIYQYINLSEARISGVEGRARVRLPGGFAWNLAAAYVRGDSRLNGVDTPLASIDPFKIVSGLDWQPAERSFGGQFVATYVAGKDASRAGVTCTGGCYVPDSYTVLDAFGWWEIRNLATVRVGVFNLTDEMYTAWSDVRGLSDTSVVKDAYTQPGRNVSASLTLKF